MKVNKLIAALFSVKIIIFVCLAIGYFIFTGSPVDNNLSLKELPHHENVGPPSCTVLSYNAGNSIHELILERLKNGVAPTTVIKKEMNYSSSAFYGHSSGVIVDSRGYVLTNDHCISFNSHNRRVVVIWKAEYMGALHVMDAEIVALGRNVSYRYSGGVSEMTDLALLRIVHGDKIVFPTVKFPRDELHSLGRRESCIFEEGLAITSPFGLSFTVSGFRISAIRSAREINESYPYDTTKFDPTLTIVQLEGATIGPGSSGGPLYNKRAEFIGIIASTVEVPGSDIIFAISVDNIKKWIRAVDESIVLP